jgi:DNA polymerase III delta subunit
MLFLLHGEDTYRLHQRIAEIRLTYRQTNPEALGETIVDADDASLDRLNAALAQGGGLFEAKGLIIGRELFAQHGEALTALLAEHGVERREEVNVVLVEATALKAAAKPLLAMAKSETFAKLTTTELVQWIGRYVQEHAPEQGPGKIEKAAAEQLAVLGPDLWRLSRELEKLLAYAAGEEKITTAHITQLVRRVNEETVFPISDGICNREPEPALAAVLRLTAEGQDPDGLAAYAMKEARQLVRAHAALNDPLPGDPQELFGAKPFVWRKRSSQARKWNDEEIQKLLDRTVALEATWKGSGDTRLALDAFILAAAK